MEKNQEENPLMRNPAYRRLVGEKNKLVKQMNFIEQRLEKYAYALSDKDVQQLNQRMDATAERLAEINDQLADIEENSSTPSNNHWIGHASQELRQASRVASK